MVGLDGYVRVWSLNGMPTVVNSFASGGGAIWDAAMDSTGKFIAMACEDGTVRIFDSESYELKGILKGGTKRIVAVVWAFEGGECIPCESFSLALNVLSFLLLVGCTAFSGPKNDPKYALFFGL